jgi:hypothetical protein
MSETTTKTETKSRPILFSGPMVRAILEGRKTQTRRVIDRVAGLGVVTCFGGSETTGYDFALRDRRGMWNEFREDELLARCPFGVPGDELWVRETWRPQSEFDPSPETGAQYWADSHAGLEKRNGDSKWRPSIHMPRWACRLTLTVTDVRVERLQGISEGDAYAEGVTIPDHMAFASNGNPELRNEARTAFCALWKSITGSESWEANPWVWVVTFERKAVS